jgi:hypothetical protein
MGGLWVALMGCASHSVVGVPSTRRAAIRVIEGPTVTGLREDGSIVVAADDSAPGFALSAPLYACTPKLYGIRGIEYPVGSAEIARTVDDVVISFDSLLAECAARYPSITLPKPDKPLSEAEKATNFRQVGECVYRFFSVKGYWIPKLLIDVDVCEHALGKGWHMPTEVETARITHDQAAALFRPPQSPSLGTSNTSAIFVRTNAGGLGVVDLGSNSPPNHISKEELDYKSHMEGHTAVRCIRSLDVSPPPRPVLPIDCSEWAKGMPVEVAGPPTTQALTRSTEFEVFERTAGNDADSFEQQAKQAEASGFENPLVLQTDAMNAARADGRAAVAFYRTSPATSLATSVTPPSFRDMRGSPNLKRIASTAARLRRGVRKALNGIQLIFAYCREHTNVPKCEGKALENYAKQSHNLQEALDALEQIPPTPDGISDEFEQLVSIEADRIERDVTAFNVASLNEAARFAYNGLNERLWRVEMAAQRCLRWGESYNWVPPTLAHPGNSLALKRIAEALKQVDLRAAQHLATLSRKIEICDAPLTTADCPPADVSSWEEKAKLLRELRQRIARWLRS